MRRLREKKELNIHKGMICNETEVIETNQLTPPHKRSRDGMRTSFCFCISLFENYTTIESTSTQFTHPQRITSIQRIPPASVCTSHMSPNSTDNFMHPNKSRVVSRHSPRLLSFVLHSTHRLSRGEGLYGNNPFEWSLESES